MVETIPDDFVYRTVQPSGGGLRRQRRDHYVFTLLDETSVMYTVTAPRVAGDYMFSGVLSDIGKMPHTVGADDTVTVQASDGPTASRAVAPNPVAQGEDVLVTIAATNYGGSAQIVETYPPNFVYVSSTPVMAVHDANARRLTFSLMAQSSVSYTLTAPSSATTGSLSGTLSDVEDNDYLIGGDNSITVEAAASTVLTVTRSFSANPVVQGGQVEVTIAVANYGAFGQIMDTVPDGFAYVDSEPPSATYDVGTRVVTFTLLDERTFRYTLTAPDTDRVYSFTGSLSDVDQVRRTIGGDIRLGVGSATVPITPPVTRPSRSRAPTNRAPSFEEGANATRSVAENSAAGTAVGDPMTATDRDDDDIAYSLVSGDTELFDINKSTGQLSVAEGASLDFESKGTYSVTVRVKDDGEKLDNITVSISVTDVDEPGMIEFSAEAPELDSELTAAVMDPDGDVTGISWQWERSEDQMAWTPIEERDRQPHTYR